MLTVPRVVFSVFTLMNIVLVTNDLAGECALSLGGVGLRAPRQLSQLTSESGAQGGPNDVNNMCGGNDCNEEEQSEAPNEGNDSSVKKGQKEKAQEEEEEGRMEKEDEKKVDEKEKEQKEEKDEKEEYDDKSTKDDISDDSDDDDDDDDDNYDDDDDEDGGIDISGILKEHVFIIPKEKVELLLDECNRIQNLDYERALDNLFGELHDLSLKYGLPKDEKMALWYEFLDDITDDLKEVDDYYNNIYEFNMNSPTVLTASFVYSLMNFLNIWTTTIEGIEKKWCTIFAERTVAYKDGAREGKLSKEVNESTQKVKIGTTSSEVGNGAPQKEETDAKGFQVQ
ncbi:Plasmodium exported protein, unknown function [Plasmodium knowlesi strain H]|uniref:Plasmodium RESA N-terminal domain-containing protein n=3 Tax=Plasmodium knowlesi TaxID=5850 RepID=A0A5K1US33_PLAKH|nr:Plasmodium exported protein (PHIST), unknown function [Plasmodium knowlesi strain H]OTN68051.1 Uncharacterized protein PKNOH_S04360800 [Plasmodium knowlesi]CAA9986968.1 Plasmodium exported protein (PHIST), unknown function [Plasmodium knowlesi strain H]SBO26590.1 Plasmodium exported protein, unknown function [Plasmodium knowlesi strain H]SBO28174.1 Plasmodium exported protein, unknown function [Plasmodium knowlesi strain H]VVS76442.1 Plasmodium exported protein (PHIST), unknown function [Pl|eukprot:XP_002258213.1 hypothetical protein, conserved in Plasmodium species [Plasmodium knowlesi strain H]